MDDFNPDDIFLKKPATETEKPEDLPLFMDTVDENLSALFPETTGDDVKNGTDFIEDSIFDFYEKLPVKPFIRTIDMNNSKEEPDVNRPKTSLEIGITFDF